MKYKIALMLLALPLGLCVLAKSASAAEFNTAPNATRVPVIVADRNRPDRNRDYPRGEMQSDRGQPPRREEARRPGERRVWVQGHWQRTARGRQWVPGYYEARR